MKIIFRLAGDKDGGGLGSILFIIFDQGVFNPRAAAAANK
jgi:hypothetical protein